MSSRGPCVGGSRHRASAMDLSARESPFCYGLVLRRGAESGTFCIDCTGRPIRATGITEFLRNGSKLEIAQQMVNHESARTTGLCDRRDYQVSLDELETIFIRSSAESTPLIFAHNTRHRFGPPSPERCPLLPPAVRTANTARTQLIKPNVAFYGLRKRRGERCHVERVARRAIS